MLIQEKLLTGDFSPSERIVIAYILQQKLELANMTTKQIAQATYTSPSILVRIAQKAGFPGWSDLKEALLKEEEYLSSSEGKTDANYPFQKSDGLLTIASKIAALEQEAIHETRRLLNSQQLQKAVQILQNAERICLFALGGNQLVAQEFRYRMLRIGRQVDDCVTLQSDLYHAWFLPENSCGLFLSYSGESQDLIQAMKLLKRRKIPTILLTNIGESSLSRMADCVLHICTREKLYSKIGSYSTDTSFFYLLDLLYSCVFARNYEENLRKQQEASRNIEESRKKIVSTSILREDDPESEQEAE